MLVLDDDCNRTISIHSSILAGNDCATKTLASTFSTHKKINNCVAAQFKRGMCFYVNACVCKCVCMCVCSVCIVMLICYNYKTLGAQQRRTHNQPQAERTQLFPSVVCQAKRFSVLLFSCGWVLVWSFLRFDGTYADLESR